jgi:hypothetical protein
MESLTELLTVLNDLSPIAVIGLLGAIIYILVSGRTPVTQKIDEIKDNHLHELPKIASDIHDQTNILRRIEVKMGEEFSYLKARINGK